MPADMEMSTDSDLLVADGSRVRRAVSWKVAAALAVGATVVLAPAAVAFSRRPGQASMSGALQEVEVTPKVQNCAGPTENCFGNKCCKVSGTSCWHVAEGTAKCGKTCPPGSPCFVEKVFYAYKPTMQTVDTSLYCYTMYASKRGPELDNPHDLEILKYQVSLGAGVFGCNDWAVFSDKTIDLGSGASTTSVLGEDGKLPELYTTMFREDKPDHYLNTALFMQAWRLMKTEQKFMEFSWVIKVDPPTVLLPDVLRTKLPTADTATGTYMENCQGVIEGYFGAVEVASKTAFKRFLEQVENAFASSCWKWDTEKCKKEWPLGPWGEDLFMQRCMDDAEVAKLEDFHIVKTGTCPKQRPESQKNNKSYVPPCKPDLGVAAVHPLRTKAAWAECYDKLR